MSELEHAEEIVTTAVVTTTRENVIARRTIVYETPIDPAVARVAAEKNKSKLFRKFLFRLNNPEDIEFVSIMKYYEPFVVVSGKYFIDYYRKCRYSVKVDRDVKEVILFDRTFIPAQSYTSAGDRNVRLDGEERLVKEARAFLVLNKFGQDTGLKGIPSAV